MDRVPAETKGYPTLGLSANSLHIPSRSDASPARLSASVERWERSIGGSTSFKLRSMSRIPIELAQEAAHVYVSLREAFPSASPSYVDLASRPLSRWYGSLLPANQPLALATTYECVEPLRSLTDYRLPPRSVLESLKAPSLELRSAVAQAESLGISDVWTTGGIDLSTSFGSRTAYLELLKMRAKPSRPHPSGTRAAIPHVLSALSYALVHEFGHLVDAELAILGSDAREFVYGELSCAVLGLDKTPSVKQYSLHLVNYPSISHPGPHAGSVARARILKSSTGSSIASVLGRYAATNRDELFAESFVAMYAADNIELRHDLKRFRAALCEVGLGTLRRPNRV